MKQLFSYFQLLVYAGPTWPDIALMAVGFVTAAAAGVPFPLMGILFGQLVDDMNNSTCEEARGSPDIAELRAGVNDKVLKLVYISIASFVLIYVYVLSWSLVSQRLGHRLRDKYFQGILRQEPSFFDNRQAGEVSSRLNGDVQAVQAGTSEKVGIYIASISFFITAYVVAFIKDAQLAGMLVSLLPAFLLMGIVGGFYVQKFSGIMSDGIAAASSIASEALTHIAVVQAFGAEERLESKFAKDMMKAQQAGIKKAIAAAVQAGTMYFIAYSANALAFWQGSKKIADTIAGRGNSASIGQIYTVVFLLVDGEFRLIYPIGSRWLILWQRALFSARWHRCSHSLAARLRPF
jgi:ATP-binding cassette, subfamily B (MDR/TAP), member 1